MRVQVSAKVGKILEDKDRDESLDLPADLRGRFPDVWQHIAGCRIEKCL